MYDWLGIGLTVFGGALPIAAGIVKWKGSIVKVDVREFYHFKYRMYKLVTHLRRDIRTLRKATKK